jgi:hypothetical protein
VRTTSKARRNRLAILRRRLDYIIAKARHDSSENAANWYRAERDSLEWVLEVVEAAILIGTLDELEKVAGLPDPEAWMRRGEVVRDE